MQQAIPYKSWPQLPLNRNCLPESVDRKPVSQFKGTEIRDLVSENAVIVIARRGCCMSHVVKRLLNGHGVNPSVFEFEEDEEKEVVKEVEKIGDGGNINNNININQGVQFPAVFIGGRMFGGLDQVMATHINGELIPVLKQAGALWL